MHGNDVCMCAAVLVILYIAWMSGHLPIRFGPSAACGTTACRTGACASARRVTSARRAKKTGRGMAPTTASNPPKETPTIIIPPGALDTKETETPKETTDAPPPMSREERIRSLLVANKGQTSSIEMGGPVYKAGQMGTRSPWMQLMQNGCNTSAPPPQEKPRFTPYFNAPPSYEHNFTDNAAPCETAAA